MKKQLNTAVKITDKGGNSYIYDSIEKATITGLSEQAIKIREECPIKTLPFTIIWKKQDKNGGNSPGTVAIVDINVLWDYLKMKYEKINN